MHHWVKLCVNRLRKYEVIVLTIFCIATSKSRFKVGEGHSSSNSSKAMVGCITGSNFVQIGEGNLKLSR